MKLKNKKLQKIQDEQKQPNLTNHLSLSLLPSEKSMHKSTRVMLVFILIEGMADVYRWTFLYHGEWQEAGI